MHADSLYHRRLDGPVGGLLAVLREDGALVALPFLDRPGGPPADPEEILARLAGEGPTAPAGRRADDVARQLDEYFTHRRQRFDLPLAPAGTPFQLAVWAALQALPYGRTTSYAALAAGLGRPRAVRAVGAANGANPIPVIVPCHRVVGARGDLVGYGGGLERNRFLLALEGAATVALPFGMPAAAEAGR